MPSTLARDLRRTPKGSNANNTRLLGRVVAGDREAIQEMTLSNTALAVRLAADHIRRTGQGYLRDDLTAVALCALVAAVRKLSTSKFTSDAYPTAYLGRAIVNALNDTDDSGIGCSAKTRRRRDDIATTVNSNPTEEICDPNNLRNLRESIDSVCDSTDRRIVEMRIEGHNDGMIAGVLKVSEATINNKRHAIEKRFGQLAQ